ncbi:uncharacterized protein [Macaca fascicularis]|uniref:uncharacterized protein n=1 Tax=Macaca fascicularis TaxID=9541 RepID=UPI0032B07C55
MRSSGRAGALPGDDAKLEPGIQAEETSDPGGLEAGVSMGPCAPAPSSPSPLDVWEAGPASSPTPGASHEGHWPRGASPLLCCPQSFPSIGGDSGDDPGPGQTTDPSSWGSRGPPVPQGPPTCPGAGKGCVQLCPGGKGPPPQVSLSAAGFGRVPLSVEGGEGAAAGEAPRRPEALLGTEVASGPFLKSPTPAGGRGGCGFPGGGRPRCASGSGFQVEQGPSPPRGAEITAPRVGGGCWGGRSAAHPAPSPHPAPPALRAPGPPPRPPPETPGGAPAPTRESPPPSPGSATRAGGPPGPEVRAPGEARGRAREEPETPETPPRARPAARGIPRPPLCVSPAAPALTFPRRGPREAAHEEFPR